MVALNIITPAWQRYLTYLQEHFNSKNEVATIESMSAVLNREYNGIVLEHPSWAVWFATEQDLEWFLLKWS